MLLSFAFNYLFGFRITKEKSLPTRRYEGKEDTVPFIKYLLGTILSAYRDFEDRFALVGTKLPALEPVRRATMNKIGRFSNQYIRELCPSLSISSIEGAL